MHFYNGKECSLLLPGFPVTHPRNHNHPQLGGSTPADGRVKGLSFFDPLGPHGTRRSLRASLVHRVTVLVRIVAPAPFEAAPDAPACAVELATHQPRSGSLPRDNIDQYCEVRLAGNSTSIRLSPDSSAWFCGAEGRQVLACLP